jgi:uncharacterized secreted protein with C-terminal beta-propeller domain
VLFSWENGNFVQLLSKEADMTNWEKYRGLYVGDFFYLVSPGEVVTFDRKNGYAECGSLNF